MKKLILALFFAAAIGPAIAQKKISVNESTENIGNGRNSALTVVIYASASDIEKEWKSLMKDYKAKVSAKKEIFADDAVIKAIGPNTLDVFAKTEDNKDGSVKFIVAFDLGGAFLSSSAHSAQYKEAKRILHDFAVKVSKKAVEDELSIEEKQQKKLEKDYDDLVKNKLTLEKEIESYKSKIKKAEDDIQKNLKEQEAKQKELDVQKKNVSNVQSKLKAID
jgi:hypothetical protein